MLSYLYSLNFSFFVLIMLNINLFLLFFNLKFIFMGLHHLNTKTRVSLYIIGHNLLSYHN